MAEEIVNLIIKKSLDEGNQKKSSFSLSLSPCFDMFYDIYLNDGSKHSYEEENYSIYKDYSITFDNEYVYLYEENVLLMKINKSGKSKYDLIKNIIADMACNSANTFMNDITNIAYINHNNIKNIIFYTTEIYNYNMQVSCYFENYNVFIDNTSNRTTMVDYITCIDTIEDYLNINYEKETNKDIRYYMTLSSCLYSRYSDKIYGILNMYLNL